MKKRFKNFIEKGLNKHEKAFKMSVLALVLAMSFGVNPSYASSGVKLIDGTVDLFDAISGWLLLIIPTGAGTVLGYHALQKSLSDDQAVIAEKNKAMKNVIIGAAIATTASGLVKIVLAFYN